MQACFLLWRCRHIQTAPHAAVYRKHPSPPAHSTPPLLLCICLRLIHAGVLLGAGSFGRVFKGKWCGMDVAIKVMSCSQGELERVLREAEIMLGLEHPNIVRALYCSVVEPQPTEEPHQQSTSSTAGVLNVNSTADAVSAAAAGSGVHAAGSLGGSSQGRGRGIGAWLARATMHDQDSSNAASGVGGGGRGSGGGRSSSSNNAGRSSNGNNAGHSGRHHQSGLPSWPGNSDSQLLPERSTAALASMGDACMPALPQGHLVELRSGSYAADEDEEQLKIRQPVEVRRSSQPFTCLIHPPMPCLWAVSHILYALL